MRDFVGFVLFWIGFNLNKRLVRTILTEWQQISYGTRSKFVSKLARKNEYFHISHTYVASMPSLYHVHNILRGADTHSNSYPLHIQPRHAYCTCDAIQYEPIPMRSRGHAHTSGNIIFVSSHSKRQIIHRISDEIRFYFEYGVICCWLVLDFRLFWLYLCSSYRISACHGIVQNILL